MAPSRLNPAALPFYPASMQKPPPQPPTVNWDDLPQGVISSIIACLSSPSDLVSCALSCKPLLTELGCAELSLSLSGAKEGSARPQHVQLSSPYLSSTAQMVTSVPKYMPGVARLDVSGLPLDDKDLSALLAGLPRLSHLDMAACRRITSRFVTNLVSSLLQQLQANHAAQQQPAEQPAQLGAAAGKDSCAAVGTAQGTAAGGQSLQVLNMQRCFQLRDSAMGELLLAVSAGLLPLQTLAMSHLDLSGWPWHSLRPPTIPPPTTTPTVAQPTHVMPTITNDLTADVFTDTLYAAMTAASEAFDAAAAQHQLDTATETDTVLSLVSYTRGLGLVSNGFQGQSLTVLALNNCSGLNVTALSAVAVLCPQLRYLMLGGGTIPGPQSTGGMAVGVGGEQPQPLLPLAVSQKLPYLTSQLTPYVSCGGASGGVPVADSTWLIDAAVGLSAALLTLSHLKVVELTFLPQPVVARVKRALELHARDTGHAPEVWDLTQGHSVSAALTALDAAAAADRRSTRSSTGSRALLAGAAGSRSSGSQRHAAQSVHGEPSLSALQLALRCAANCSNGARVAPAHVAAERGDVCVLRGLLRVGSGVDCKDRAGATPLFLAAEAGHEACVRALLEAGADPQLANAAGELPLYIAALRGHLGVLTALLDHFTRTGLPWQEASLYGDSWTPLMAAAVADRHDVALALLHAADTRAPTCAPAADAARRLDRAAGAERGAAALVRAVNRYGQCVLHIAARKASARLLRLLLNACAADVCQHHPATTRHPHTGSVCCYTANVTAIPDSNGDTPLDVARKFANVSALSELTRPLSHGPRGAAAHAGRATVGTTIKSRV